MKKKLFAIVLAIITVIFPLTASANVGNEREEAIFNAGYVNEEIIMSKIGNVDKNMNSKNNKSKLEYIDVRKTDAKIYGLVENEYNRLPKQQRQMANKKLRYLQDNTSGGRIRFITNSKKLGIKVKLKHSDLIYNFSYIGFSGIDCYSGFDNKNLNFLGVCCPNIYRKKAKTEFNLSGKDEQITLYLPIYNSIEKLEIAVEDGAYIKSPNPYKNEIPIVYYGSSITQGGCSSRAGNSYCALVSRWLDSDFECLGFSGNAKGELWLAEYIANKQMSAFVYDYDFNAPNIEHLKSTYLPFIKTILDVNPTLPVIMMSKPSAHLEGEDIERRNFIKKTYEDLKNQGYNVYFIDGETLFGTDSNECCTVDKIHPNDLGFYRMAKNVYSVLENIVQ